MNIKKLAFCLSLCAALSAPLTNAIASPKGRAYFPDSIRNVYERAKTVKALPDASLKETLEFHIALNMRDYPALLARITTGEKISPEEMAGKYLPLDADYQAVIKWVESQGLKVTQTDPSHLSVFVKGTIKQLQTVLQVEFAKVTVTEGTYTSAKTAPSLPEEIAGVVLGINGLQPHLHPHKTIVRPDATSSFKPPFKVGEILSAYNAAGLDVTGSGQKIAILIDTVPANSDLTAFWANNGIPQSLSNIEEVNVTGASLPAPSGEETLDTEWSSSIAPAAKIRIYATSDLSFNSLDKGFQRIISDLPSQQQIHALSISLGLGETEISTSQLKTDSQYFASIASFGVSVFVSTGDDGATTDGVLQPSYFSTDPSVTAVGGTTLNVSTSTGAVTSEKAWSGSGGGISTYFKRPSWQTGTGVLSGTMRLVPDVASVADPNTGAYVYLDGSVQQFGGTSWSAPTWAGYSALINQALAASGQAPLGLMNPKLYPLNGTACFRDITSGNNGNYSCTVGYDLVTGLGTPNVQLLLQALVGNGSSNPQISGFNPQSGEVGTTVQITGANLGTTNFVAFNGVSGSFSVISPNQINAVVPVNATTGPISLVTGSNLSASSINSFTVVNDLFAYPQELTSQDSGSVNGSNVAATKPNGDPNVDGNSGGHLIWFAWVAPDTGTFTFNTIGSSFNTLLGIYTGTALNNLALVASAGGTNPGTGSLVNFDAIAGTTYYIAVDGYNGATGSLVLTWFENTTDLQITSFTPTSGPAGTSVTVTGVNFKNITGVQFNGVSAPYTTGTDTQLTAVVPSGATTGPISVATLSGTAFSNASFLVLGNVQPGSTTLYATDFSAAEGYTTSSPLAGQNGWLESGQGGNGILSNAFGTGGQQAYIGFTSQPSGSSESFVWQPINFTPTATSPIVTFSVQMSIVDSTNNRYDDFDWSVFNIAGNFLFGIDFDNFDNHIYYLLNGSNSGYVDTGTTFTNGTAYSLQVTMDYAHNTWSATLNGTTTLVSNQPITVSSQNLDLGDIDATWIFRRANAPGNNYMVFGDYLVASDPPQQPLISSQPQSQAVNAGSTVAFGVVATGATPLTYSWSKNGKALNGADGSTLTITSAQPSDAGTYAVTVSNSFGSVTSSKAVLVVNQPPVIITDPASQTISAGKSVVFTGTASGYPVPTYQWTYKGNNITGATKSVLTLKNVQPANAGNYALVAINTSGTATSQTATLTVGLPFSATAGFYSELITPSAGGAATGVIKITTSSTGSFSGSVILNGITYTLSGAFNASGFWSKSVGKVGGQPVTVTLQLAIDGSNQVTGAVTIGALTYNYTADRAFYKANTNTAPQKGSYTVWLPPDPNATGTNHSQGYGYGTATVDGSGNVRFSGVLGDQTAVSQATTLTSAGVWSFYIPLYSHQGWIAGDVVFDSTLPRPGFGGTLEWIKPIVQSGTTVVLSSTTQLIGSPYTPPATGTTALNFGASSQATVSFTNGLFTETIVVDTKDKVSPVSGPLPFTMTIANSSGLFSGTVLPPGATKAISFKGALFQNGNAGGAGLFKGAVQTEPVFITPSN